MIQSSSLKLKKCFEDHSFVFDLDDTIFYEKDYVISGFHAISRNLFKKKLVNKKFNSLINLYNKFSDPFEEFCRQNREIKKNELIKIMREHSPKIKARPGFKNLIKLIKENGNEIGVITNGRSKTQRSKFYSLGLHNFVDILIISSEVKLEKPNIKIFDLYQYKSRSKKFIFFGNNPRLDIRPIENKECWKTVFCKSNLKMVKKYDKPNSDLKISSFMDKSLYNEFFIKR
tara:strand:- start:4547 stop:5236 length:690 start_codon:yes stop_codon:yes gene_type:complete